ncbi:MAG: VWA domain-containing protein [Bacteroidia bacterium]|nr:VWA domain-containing protein [Bacteroidia bacterium]
MSVIKKINISKSLISTKAVFAFIIFLSLQMLNVVPAGSYYPSTPPNKTRILFLLDASQSMIGKWQSGTKYEVARRLLSNLVDSLQNIDHLEMGLRVYGHTKRYPPQDCDDTRLEVPIGSGNALDIRKRLDIIRPSGTTPIAMSLEECAGDFPNDPSRNIIIIITDGIEECNGDPCAVSLALQKKGIVLKPFIIGMGMKKEFIKAFKCVGTYYDASNEESFKKAFDIVISQALNNTTVQVNLLDAFEKPSETNVNMTFYDKFSGSLRYNFIHTMNHRGFPDTLTIDPSETYRIVVHTIPPVTLDSAAANPGKHNVFAIDVPQGDLALGFDGTSAYKGLKCIVRKAGKDKTLHVQDFNSTERYITGNYDLEILCLPRLHVNNVDISQSKTTTVKIPKPGLITILRNSVGHGSVYVVRNNELEWVTNLDQDKIKETIVLQPGNYRVAYRPKSSREAEYTVDKSFRITSGTSKSIKLN